MYEGNTVDMVKSICFS